MKDFEKFPGAESAKGNIKYSSPGILENVSTAIVTEFTLLSFFFSNGKVLFFLKFD